MWLRWPPVACLSVPSRSQHVCVSSCAASGLALLLLPMPVLTRCLERHPRMIVRMRLPVDLTSTPAPAAASPCLRRPPELRRYHVPVGRAVGAGGNAQPERNEPVAQPVARVVLVRARTAEQRAQELAGSACDWDLCEGLPSNNMQFKQTVGGGESCIIALHSAQLLMPMTRRARHERALLLCRRAG